MKGLLVLLLAASAQATPYFRPLDFAHPQPIAGALVDPSQPANSEGAAMLPIFTHDPDDGCLRQITGIPFLPCEDWTPLAVGASMNAGKITFDVAPLWNVLPWMSQGLLALVPAKYEELRGILENENYNSVTFSAGPVWEYKQAENKGYFRVFTGLAMHF